MITKNLRLNKLPNEGQYIFVAQAKYFYSYDEEDCVYNLWVLGDYKASHIESFACKADIFEKSYINFSEAYFCNDDGKRVNMTSPKIIYYKQGARFICKKWPSFNNLLLVRVSTTEFQLIDIETANRFGKPITHNSENEITNEQLEQHNHFGEFIECLGMVGN